MKLLKPIVTTFVLLACVCGAGATPELTESKRYADSPHWTHETIYGDGGWSVSSIWDQQYELSTDTDPYIIVNYWVDEPTDVREFRMVWTYDLTFEGGCSNSVVPGWCKGNLPTGWCDNHSRDGWWTLGIISPRESRGTATLIIDRNHVLLDKISNSRSGFVMIQTGAAGETNLVYDYEFVNWPWPDQPPAGPPGPPGGGPPPIP